MLKKFFLFTDRLAKGLSPVVLKISPLYKKYFLPTQKNFVSAFMDKCSPWMKISSIEKKKMLEKNLLAKFRIASVILCLLQIFLSAVFDFSTLPFFFFGFFAFLIFKGYRSAYLLAALGFVFDVVSLLFFSTVNSLFILLWLVIGVAVLFFGFKYENARIDLEKKFELRKSQTAPLSDCIAAFLAAVFLWLVSCFLSLFIANNSAYADFSDEENQQLYIASGTVARHVFGYADYCQSKGYQLTNYPNAFIKKFDPAVSKIQNALTERGSSLADFYHNAQKVFGNRLYESLAQDIEKVRHQAIIEMVALKQNIPTDKVVWSDDYDKLISSEEGCVIFDEMAESIVASLVHSPSIEQLLSF